MAYISGPREASQTFAQLLSSRLVFTTSEPHIWWGVSVEDKKDGLPRVPDLTNSTAAARFLSVEPLLEDVGRFDLRGIDWMIVGGESGPGARPMEKDCVLSLRNQCRAQGVKFFFKQWGGVRKSLNGRRLDGRTYDESSPCISSSVSAASECTRMAAEIEAGDWPSDLVQVSWPVRHA